jgi:hypothetical protein
MLSPGLGHIYLREWVRALLWFGLIFTTISILVPVSTEPTGGSIAAMYQASYAAVVETPLRNKLAMVGITALSMADAYWLASQGNKLAAAAAEGDQCPHCGKETDLGLDFCHWCTEPLGDVGEPSSPPQE